MCNGDFYILRLYECVRDIVPFIDDLIFSKALKKNDYTIIVINEQTHTHVTRIYRCSLFEKMIKS